jgi:carboxylate-amine ligase
VPFKELVDEWLAIVRQEALRLGCLKEVERARHIVAQGSSADHQLRVYHKAIEGGFSPEESRRLVVDWLLQETIRYCDA